MISIKKILVPTDFSTLSVPGIGYACSLAKDYGAEVIVLHVLPARAMKDHYTQGYVAEGLISPGQAPVGIPRQASPEDVFETRKQRLVNFLEQKLGPALLNKVTIRPSIKVGKVVEEIVASAKEARCDLIVMTSQASGIRRLLRGSLTERVARRAPCPVITIQPSAEVRTENDERLPVNRVDKWAA